MNVVMSLSGTVYEGMYVNQLSIVYILGTTPFA
jgi:hypothetical protein